MSLEYINTPTHVLSFISDRTELQNGGQTFTNLRLINCVSNKMLVPTEGA